MKRISPMSIIKVELRLQELSKVIKAFKTNRKGALETFSKELKKAVASSFNELMQAEIDLFLGSADQSSNKKMDIMKKENMPSKALVVLGFECREIETAILNLRSYHLMNV